jgi:phenylalanyl-tRNA synthetase beta chain
MKISYNWLKEYIDIDLAPEVVSQILTDTGLEVEGLEKIDTVKGGLRGVVIGEVKTCIKHPDADKLSVTTVDVGDGKILPIVCGAPNVSAGQKVVVATVGTTLYSGDTSFDIKKAKIRGEVSEGMICAEDELGLGSSHEGIMVLPEDAEVGTAASAYFNIEEDYVFEIGLTPNRTDAMSHIGVARDLVAALNLQRPDRDPISLFQSCINGFKTDNLDLPIEVIVEDAEACPRYTGVTMTGVEVKESPDWLKNHLLVIGLRPINNLVDISNFILHETGHPLHFFDADKISGGKIVVKKEPKGTKFTTLDEIERELSGNDLMICNSEKGMCIGGVFGGLDSGVTEKTKNIFLECAYFDPKTIRKTARFHGLNTDSSFRFERGADPNDTVDVIKRAVLLIKELAGGKVSSDIVDVYPKPIENWEIEVAYKNIDRLIGKKIPHDQIKDILIWVGMEIISQDDKTLKISVPTFKNDVRREADVIEEILRIYGYNNVEIPEQLRASLSYQPKPDREKLQNLISDYLTSNGFVEMMNNSLTKGSYAAKFDFIQENGNVKMRNPLSSDLNVMRQSLIFGGLETIIYNNNRKSFDLKLYEFGTIYKLNNDKLNKANALAKYNEKKHFSVFMTGKSNNETWRQEQKNTDFFDLKYFGVNILKKLNLEITDLELETISNEVFESGIRYSKNNKVLVELGTLTKNVLNAFEIKQAVYYADFNWDLIVSLMKSQGIQYKEVPKYPEVRRDLALLVDKNVRFDDLQKLAFKTERNILKKVSLFDVYEGEKIGKGKKSYALSFILQDERKTLTDKLIDKTMQRLQGAYEREMQAVIR